MNIKIPTTALLALALGLVACETPDDGLTDLQTGGGHVIDDRGWAVGSRVSLSAWSDSVNVQNIDITFEGPDGADAVEVVEGSDYGYVDDAMSPAPMDLFFTMPWNMMYGGGASAYVDAEVVAGGDVDIVVRTGSGKELERVPVKTAEIDDYKLGVVLDDCPEFADLVLRDEPTFLDDSYVMVMPAPIDIDGNHLIGHVDFTVDGGGSDSLYDDYGWYGGWVDLSITGDTSVTFTIDGQEHPFPIKSASADELVSLEIQALDEKHGIDNESLLCAIGRTADGTEVHGVSADWSVGWQASTVHASNFDVVDACFGDLCATWSGPGVD